MASHDDLSAAAALIGSAAEPLDGETDVAKVLDAIGDASLVLLGEATHGTHDFYALRARLTRGLIEQRGFGAVAIEGDWPDAYRVNRHVQGDEPRIDPDDALGGFERFPTWMWRNTAVVDFVSWLRHHNASLAEPQARVGFYGLDLYSLHDSIRAVIDYLERHDPEAARGARQSYSCFEQFGHDTDLYAWAAGRIGEESCEDAVARELVALRERRAHLLRADGHAASDEFFYAIQNARLARNAERYYRTMAHGHVASWNLRDQHMAETLEELRQHLRARGSSDKVVVWAHNSHLGDARATEMGRRGELNVGQLVRERHGDRARLVGFTTYSGSVIAASEWGERPQRKRVRPALAGSYEELFHAAGIPRFLLRLDAPGAARDFLRERRLERAIGVIYRPETERWSHYFDAQLADQFDAVIHIDETTALQPLEAIAAWEPSEAPETFPSGV